MKHDEDHRGEGGEQESVALVGKWRPEEDRDGGDKESGDEDEAFS